MQIGGDRTSSTRLSCGIAHRVARAWAKEEAETPKNDEARTVSDAGLALADLDDGRVVFEELLGLTGFGELHEQRVAVHLRHLSAAERLVIHGVARGERHLRGGLLLGARAHVGTAHARGALVAAAGRTRRAGAAEHAAAARLAAAEGLRSGVTAFIDMGTAHCQDAIFETMRDVGMRGLFGKCMLDLGGTDVPAALMEDTETCLRESERLMNRWHMSAGGRLRYAFAPRFVPSCTETLLTRTRDMARANGVRLHTHASENKGECAYVESLVHMRNLRYLHSIGYTGEDVILAHCIWIDDDEIRILADTGTHAVHCPSSNMKLASGIARIDEMLAAGCRVALGLDGAHNHMDALVELRQAGILQKVRTNRPTALSPLQALEMATLGGARALGQEDELGSLEPGKKADLAVINPDRLNMAPRIGRDPVAQVVYQATHENVEATMVDGVFLYRDGKYTTLDLGECLRDAESACARILRSPDVAPLFAH